MIRWLTEWLDDRTGYRDLLRGLLYEHIPGGPRWRYVWGSTLVFTFTIQVITGLCLWTVYSPGVQNAWASVHYIEHEMQLGSMLRGLHHYTAQAMVILLVLHFVQIVWDGAYRAPREINYWLGLILALVVLALALTGYLLPWDQKGYYATQVATKIVSAAPVIGPALQNLIQGGDDYGQLTLTRFFALHAGFLPAILVLVLVAHLALFRRHGVTPPRDLRGREDGYFWPVQVRKDALACLVVLAVVMGLAVGKGAELAAPADPAEPFSAARPEWYFLALFQFLKFEWVEHLGLAFGAIYLPAAILIYLAVMPLIAYAPRGHLLNRIVMLGMVTIVVGLTGWAWYEDRTNPDHQAALAEANRDAARARQLASLPSRIPLEGPTRLLHEDPYTRGPRIFAAHCAACHHYRGHNGRGQILQERDPDTGELRPVLPTAPDLGNLGSREWMRSILVDFSNHFATLKNAPWYGKQGIDVDESEMNNWSGDREALLAEENREDLDALVEFLVSETGRRDLAIDPAKVERGRELAVEGSWSGTLEGTSCRDCHETIGEPFDADSKMDSGYPDLAQYLSYSWLVDFIADPGSPQHYGDRNQMPAYRDRLSPEELDLLARWLSHDYLPPPEALGARDR